MNQPFADLVVEVVAIDGAVASIKVGGKSRLVTLATIPPSCRFDGARYYVSDTHAMTPRKIADQVVRA